MLLASRSAPGSPGGKLGVFSHSRGACLLQALLCVYLSCKGAVAALMGCRLVAAALLFPALKYADKVSM